MNREPLDVRNASLAVALAIMREAAQWLSERGETLRRLDDLTPERIGARCLSHEIFVGYRHSEAVVSALLQDRDPFVWPGVHDSLFVHKLAVRRAVAGQGVASQMLDWASTHARQRGKKFLRLDCAGDRPKLCAFYERCGFSPVDRKMIGSFDAALYELAL